MRRLSAGVAAATVCALLAACATTPPTPEQRVAQRAQARWDALMAGKTKDAYEFLSPASRAVTNYQEWLGSAIPSATVWKAVKVAKVECGDAQRCKARVNIDHQPLVGGASLGTMSTAIDEIWLIDNGEWWLLYRR